MTALFHFIHVVTVSFVEIHVVMAGFGFFLTERNRGRRQADGIVTNPPGIRPGFVLRPATSIKVFLEIIVPTINQVAARGGVGGIIYSISAERFGVQAITWAAQHVEVLETIL